ncbi:MAG: YHS domain-containing protein [bacterium]
MNRFLSSLFLLLALSVIPLSSATACDGAKCGEGDCSMHKQAMEQEGIKTASADSLETALDPLCGMKISRAVAVDQVEYKGNVYYFCMKEEKDIFLKDPEKYLKKADDTKETPK